MSTLRKSRQALDYVRTFVRNSPWLSIAVLLHVLLVAILSIVFLTSHEAQRDAPPTTVVIAPPAIEPPPAIEDPPELIDRDSVPVLPDQQPGIVNPSEEYVLDAAPGLVGEPGEDNDLSKDPGNFNPDPEALSTLPSGAPGGTSIGMGEIGHFGLAPSAFAGRRVGPGGKGGGGPGQRGGGGPGGSEPPQARLSVLSALMWFKNHQSPDGGWDCDGFAKQCRTNTCSGPGYSAHDVGVTGLALLCFLGAGETNEGGPFKTTVRNGLKYLMDRQDADGCIGERVGHQFLYDHACAALALSEAYGMTQQPVFRQPAQRAINFILAAQNPYRAWRYDFPPSGDNDTSVTGWMVMALKSAKLAGLTIDEAALQGALNWIDEMTDDQSGRTGYIERGSVPSRLQELSDKFPAQSSEAMTAVGVLCRIFAGRAPDQDRMILAGAGLMADKLPRWDPESGAIDFYYWYYATLAMFQVGGPSWERWRGAMETAILDHQRKDKDEDEYGSWDPIDAWSDVGGRVYSTALNCLCMEVYHRYPRVFGQKR